MCTVSTCFLTRAERVPLLVIALLSALALCSCGDDDEARVQCNDPFAVNFDPNASTNEACLYPGSIRQVTTLTDLPSSMGEISGLAPYGDLLIGHNDRGNPPNLFVFDKADGAVSYTMNVTNRSNSDWEDLAYNENYLFIGDMGNNDGNRTNLAIHRVPWSNFNPESSTDLQADASLAFSYPEQTQFNQADHNFDCEAIFYWGDHIYLFTKNRLDRRSNLYRISAQPGPAQFAELLGGFNSSGRITGADLNEDGSLLALMGYNRNGNCFVWKFSEFPLGDFLSGRKEQYILGPFSTFGQMESILFENDSTLYIASEAVSELGLPPRLFRLDGF